MPLAIMKQLVGLGGKPVKTLLKFFFFVTMFCSSYAKAENLLDGADLGYGEYLSGECVTCHSKDGVDKGIPAINGLDAEVFASIMYAYKTGEMDHPVMMECSGQILSGVRQLGWSSWAFGLRGGADGLKDTRE